MNTHLKKPGPFVAPYSNIPLTKEELDRRKRSYHQLKQIGIHPSGIVDDDCEDESENPYRIQAMLMIYRDEDVPDGLIHKIKQYDLEHKGKTCQAATILP